jgi:hypothetical protein
VNQPHIPNPEWATPSFSQTPSLFVAVIVAGAILAARERRAARWALFLMACLLAFRYIRNLGLFFVLLPAVVGPALASWPLFSQGGHRRKGRRRVLSVAAFVLAAVMVGAVAAAPWPRFGARYADGYYPTGACDFLDREELPRSQLYNDVRFGGYLIERYAPSRLVFQDDRNEIHAALLEEIWSILRSGDVRGWSALLERYDCDTALVRYHAPIRTAPSDGRGVDIRGFSALWFPSRSWALVFWDDVAMVFVRRAGADPEFLRDFEYRILRPDDLEHLRWRVSREPDLRQPALEEARRAVASSSDNRLAEEVAAMLTDPSAAALIGP